MNWLRRKGVAVGVLITAISVTVTVTGFFFLYIGSELKAMNDKKADKELVLEMKQDIKEIKGFLHGIDKDVGIIKANMEKDK